MSVQITGTYLGNKSVSMVHEPSGATLQTTAPKDNQGDGTSFSPTDLAAASLGSCILTIMAIYADAQGIDLTGAHFKVLKSMSASPRRIAELALTYHLPKGLDEKHRQGLERCAPTCPVHRSLHPDVQTPISFIYDV